MERRHYTIRSGKIDLSEGDHMRQKSAYLGLAFFLVAGIFPLADARGERPTGIHLVEEFQSALVALAERVKPAVVNILPVSDKPHPTSRPDEGRGPQESPRGRAPDAPPGSGSGVLIDKRGFIVTNSHVVGDAEEVDVRLSDKTTLRGKVIGKDIDTDLALVKVEAFHELPFVTMGDSGKIKVGQWVMAVGNPFGLDRTVTLGVVSGLGRENVNLSRYEDFIQTDASINPGNSGGPLFNIQGEVIGINTAIINFAQGIGFAIPSNMAQTVTAQLMAKGKVIRGWLGVGIQGLTPALSAKFGVKDGEGVLVNEVFEGDPAHKAGMMPGDIILTVNGREVDTPNTLARVIAGFTPGDRPNIEVLRDGKRKNLTIELAEKKDEAVPVSLPKRPEDFWGLNVKNLTPEIIERYKIKSENGVIITHVENGSPAESEGIKEGDLIREVNQIKVSTIDDFKNVIEKANKMEGLLLRLTRENRAFFVLLKSKEK